MEPMELTEVQEATEVDPLELINFADPMLRKEPTAYVFEGNDAPALKERLLERMQELGGVGLSANQVGIDAKVFVIGDGQEDGMQKAFFNPVIMGVNSETEAMKEGCLSFPGLWLMISRPTQVMIKYWDEEGEEKMETYEGITSRVIQHEYDHMIGQNFTMRASKEKIKRALKAIDKKIKKYQRQSQPKK